MTLRRCSLVLTAACVLAACGVQGNSPAQVQADIAKAQADGQKKIADAEAKLAEIRQEASNAPTDATAGTVREATSPAASRAVRIADAEYDLAKAKAQQIYDVALARCEDRSGYMYSACKNQAKSGYDLAMAAAKSQNDAAHRAGDIEPRPPPK